MVSIFKRAISVLLVVLLSINQLIFVPAVFADQTSTQSATLTSPSPDPSLTPSPTPTPTVTSTPEPTIIPSPSATPAAILGDSTSSAVLSSPTPAPTPVSSDWQIAGDDATTLNNVELNKTYTAPQDGKVTVRFDKLTNPGKLTIKKVSTQNLTGVSPVSDTAYDISSDMQNGTFDYTLTLPTPKTQNVEVKASEDGKTFVTLGNVTAQTDTLTIANLDHFTLFIVTGTASSSFNESSSSLIINEFLYNPSSGNEWVELYNKTGSSVDLTSWTLVDAANNVKNLSGAVPANGFYVFEAASWLNNTGQESISLKDAGNSTVDEVTYESGSSTTIIGSQNLGGVPNGSQSVARTTDGGATWLIATPTKGWGDTLSAPTTVYVNSSYVGVNTGAQNQPFNTVQAAIDAVSSGGTISLSSDATITSQLNIAKSLIFDGAGHTLHATFAKTSNSNNSAIGITSSNVTIKNLTIDGTGGTNLHGVNVYKSTGITLDTVTISNNGHAAIVVNGSNVTATNLNTSNNVWGAVNVDPGVGVTTASVFTLNSGTLGESTQIWSDGSNVSGSATVSVVVSGYNMYAYPVGIANAFIWTNRPLAYAATITKSGITTRYTTIQAAITTASSGDTINVVAGTYTEQLTINKNLTLAGAGVSSTTIQAPAVMVNDSFGQKVILETTNNANVTFSGFIISGPGSSSCNSINYGVFVIGGSTLNISNSSIRNIEDAPFGGCQNGGGIRAGSNFLGQVGHANINNVSILNYQKGGIVIDGPGSTGTITNNTITGVGPTAAIAQNGIQVSRSAIATVSNNTITNNYWTGTYGGSNDPISDTNADGSAGILLYQSGSGTSITSNNLSGNQYGIWSVEAAGSISINGNTIVGGADSGSAKVTDIAVWNSQYGDVPVGTIASILNNIISNADYGLLNQDNSGSSGPVTDAHFNVFSAIRNLFAFNNATLHASNNDWGVYTDTSVLAKTSGLTNLNIDPIVGATTVVLAPTVTLDTSKTTVTVNNTTSASTINIPSNVTNPTLDVSGITTLSGGNTNATINGNITLNATTSVGTIAVAIPAGITISGASAKWAGVINAPTLVNPNNVPLPPASSGQSNAVGTLVEVGFGDVPLTFNKGVRILLAGQAGKLAGYVRNGAFTAINNTCASDSQATGDALVGGECKIDVGSDMVIWTQHFTQFVSYSQNTQVSSGTSGGGGFVSDGLGCGSHDCNTARFQAPQAQTLVASTGLASLGSTFAPSAAEILGTSTGEKIQKGEVKGEQTLAPVATQKPAANNSLNGGLIGAIASFFGAIFSFILRLFGR